MAEPQYPLVATAGMASNVRGSAQQYAMQQLGEGGLVSLSPGIPIKARNDSGANRRSGEVLAIGSSILNKLTNQHLWFAGEAPAVCEPFGVLLDPVPDGKIGPLVVAGACKALVNISHTCHGWATVADGDYVLQSAEHGPVRILNKPAGTGEKMCLVAISWEQEVGCEQCSGSCANFRTPINEIPGRIVGALQVLAVDANGCLTLLTPALCEEESGSGSGQCEENCPYIWNGSSWQGQTGHMCPSCLNECSPPSQPGTFVGQEGFGSCP